MLLQFYGFLIAGAAPLSYVSACLCPVMTNFMHCNRKKLSDSGYCIAHCAVHMRIVKLSAALPRFNGVCACLCVVNVVNTGKGK